MIKELDNIPSSELFERLQIREYEFLEHCDDFELVGELRKRGYITVRSVPSLNIIAQQTLADILLVIKDGNLDLLTKISEIINK